MTHAQILTFLVLGLMLVLFIWDRLRYDVVAVIALLAAIACGIVPINKAFAGFSNQLLPLIASALIISAAVGNSGLIEDILRPMRPLMKLRDAQIAVLVGAVTLLSALVKNVGALAILLPVAIQVARRNERSPSEFLMPLSFGSLIGGMMTLIGTSPNLIISSIRQDLTGHPYRMFDFFPVGFGISVMGLIFLSFGWRLIPIRPSEHNESDLPFHIEDYLAEVLVPLNSPLAGKTVGDLEAMAEGEVTVVGMIRQGEHHMMPYRHTRLSVGDTLMVESAPQALQELVLAAKLTLPVDRSLSRAGIAREDIAVTEAVVSTNSPMIGETSESLRLRERFGINLLAISRAGRRLTERLRSVAFQIGDVAVFQGYEQGMTSTLADLGCLPLAERRLLLGRNPNVLLPLLILLACVALSAFELVPPAVAFLGGAVTIAVLRILSLREIYASIDWPVLILLGSLIPVGEAVRDTGTTDLIAGWLSSVSAMLPVPGTMVVLLIITMLVTPLLHHAAAIIVMGPIAASLAHHLGVNLDPFLMTVAVGASCDFLTPIGHQCNALVMGPGNYHFGDYWRLGLPLSVLVAVTGVPLILLVWPLH